MTVEWVAGSSWNQWPDVHGIGGRMAVESAAGLLAGLWKSSGLARCVRPTTVAVPNKAVGSD